MLTVGHFESLGQGKSRGILTFYAAIDGQLYEIVAKGKVVKWIYPVARDGIFITTTIAVGGPRPSCPAVSPELIAHARAMAKAEGR